jgi:hypothetical protein
MARLPCQKATVPKSGLCPKPRSRGLCTVKVIFLSQAPGSHPPSVASPKHRNFSGYTHASSTSRRVYFGIYPYRENMAAMTANKAVAAETALVMPPLVAVEEVVAVDELVALVLVVAVAVLVLEVTVLLL